jgi:NAD:arginine ADP-ribosyltransferase
VLAARVAAGDFEDDGTLRPPLAGMFPSDLPVSASLTEALTSVGKGKIGPTNLRQVIRIAEGYVKQKLTQSDCSPVLKSVSTPEAAAITLYTMENTPREQSVYYMLNETLRSEDRARVRPWRDYIWLLCRALEKLPVPPQTTVFRGVRKPPAEVTACQKETGHEPFCLSGFTSTTADLALLQSETFLGTHGPRLAWVLTLTDPGAVRDVQPFSMLPGEKELLLLPNCRFSVSGALPTSDGLVLVHATQVETLDSLLGGDDDDDDEW